MFSMGKQLSKFENKNCGMTLISPGKDTDFFLKIDIYQFMFY